ncbi:MAG: hypothetical protein HYX22_01915 [Candidatus Yanofskybacteria bacterium]|nr:hypothetical protein [Candidatus Yanofskybacteria bacterium]
MRKIVLIGGSPTAGKSYTARRIAEDLKLPWISTDTIREQMRELVKKEDYPDLFHHSEATSEMAVEFLTHNTAEEIVEHQNKESLEVWKGVKAFIETDYVWGSFVVEGVAVLPKLASELKGGNDIRAFFLVDEDIERVRNTIFTRGLWDEADKYPDSVKEKEIAWVLAFNSYIKEEAKKYNLPVVSIGNRENYIDEIKLLIK